MLARKPGKPGQLFEPWFTPFALVNGAAVGLTPILLPLVAAKQGAGHVGLVMGLFNLGAFAAPITGGIADALHAHRWLATLCAALSAVSLWLFAYVDSPLQLLLALVNGAGFAGAVTIANLLIVERRPEAEWNQRLGWLETALSIGQGGALILAAWLSTLGERTGLGIAALVPAAAVPLSLILLPRLSQKPQSAPPPGTVASTAATHRLSNSGHTGEWGPASPSGLPSVPGRKPSKNAIMSALGLLRGGFGWMMAAWIPAYAGSAIVFALYPVLFQHAFGVKPQTSALAFAVIVLVSLPLFIVAGRVAQRRGPRLVMAGGLAARVVLLAVLAILAAAGSVPSAVPLAAFGGIMFAWSFLSVASPGLTGQLVPQAEGEAQGVLNAASGVAGFLGAVIGGAVASTAGYPAALALGAAATAAGLAVFAIKLLRPGRAPAKV
ncbi:MAG TPA: MFS transporter [Streptosporangiaceae bacterium]|jgi:MFS family permease|nr:MFS transporter [Streptosporangiaceae bacterium]